MSVSGMMTHCHDWGLNVSAGSRWKEMDKIKLASSRREVTRNQSFFSLFLFLFGVSSSYAQGESEKIISLFPDKSGVSTHSSTALASTASRNVYSGIPTSF